MIFGIFLLTLFSDNRVVKLSAIFFKERKCSLYFWAFSFQCYVHYSLLILNYYSIIKLMLFYFPISCQFFMHSTYLATFCIYCILYSVDCIIYLFVNRIKATSCAIRNLNFYSYVHIPLIKLFIEGNIKLKVKIYRWFSAHLFYTFSVKTASVIVVDNSTHITRLFKNMDERETIHGVL